MSTPNPLPGPVSQSDIHAQHSWVIGNDQVELAVTEQGAHMAGVSFYRGESSPVVPYYVSPWQGENLDLSAVPVLAPLRGDFFCLPFGGNGTPFRGERHPPHGETAGSVWTLDSAARQGAVTALNLSLETKVRAGRVRRELLLVDGQNVIYERTLIDGFAGPTSLAHHATLATHEQDGLFQISCRPFQYGLTCPYLFSNPENKEYQSLAIGAEFTDLSKVPVNFKDQPDADCSVFPARRGYADLLQTFSDPKSAEPDWVTAVNTKEHWLWFAFKDPAVMPGRIFWMENHGRHSSPWNGRNQCIGIEDGCMFFEKGVAESAAENTVTRRGIPTAHNLTGDRTFPVYYMQGVVKVPSGFQKVATVVLGDDAVEFVSTTGERVRAPMRAAFVQDGQLPA